MFRARFVIACTIAVILFAIATVGRSAISLDPPENFFTNVAQRILLTMSGDFTPVSNVSAIMVAPTNYYGNGLHRVMQQAANIYEATRTNEFPAVFRPLFGNLGTTNLYIVGWTNDNNAVTLGSWLDGNPIGIPLVIGAKKGFPNFNEFSTRTDILVTRKLQLVRDTNASPYAPPSQTNQMYILGISNVAAVEAWNSYYGKFPYASTIEVSNAITFTLTNFVGVQGGQTIEAFGTTNIPANAWDGWPGYSFGSGARLSFKLPLITNLSVYSNSVYVAQSNQFQQVGTNVYETGLINPFYLPDWILVVTNRLVYIHRVGTSIIDFVVLRDVAVIGLSTNLRASALSPPTAFGSMWDTNRNFGAFGPTEGIRNQIAFSQVTGNNGDWNAYSTFNGSNNDRDAAALRFRQFLGGATNSPAVMETPFNPVARMIYNKTWQANDPLVHYHVGDLTAFQPSVTFEPVKWREANLDKVGSSTITNVNRPYAPWNKPGDPAAYDYRLRDPGVRDSASWNFPSEGSLSATWLGRVHRGTPWQTIYLKAARDYGETITGSALTLADWNAAANMAIPSAGGGTRILNHPTNDWRLAAVLAPLFNTNDVSELHSVNATSNSIWVDAFTDLSVTTNILADDEVANPANFIRFASFNIAADASQIPELVDAINSARAHQSRGFFPDISALIAVPALNTESPWLNRTDNQRAYGISDEAYEMLPSQLLERLRANPSVTIGKCGGGEVIEINGCDGCAYEIQTSANLQDWDDLGGPYDVTNGVIRVTLPPVEPPAFFRVLEIR